MSQHDYNIANGGGAAVRADINSALAAIQSVNSGPTAPTATQPFMPWYDTTTGKLMMRNAANSGWVDAVNAINSGQLAGMRNKIINGKMEIAQRGASGTSNNGYIADRWILAHTGTAPTWGLGNGGQFLGEFFARALQITGAASNTGVSLVQRIEALNSADLCGKPVTFSAYVFHSGTGGERNVTIAAQRPNAADTWSGTTSIGNSGSISVPISTWTRVTWTTTMPSSGPDFGLSFEIAFGAVTAGQLFVVTGVQLEVGSVATPFEHRPFGAELGLCRRYGRPMPNLILGQAFSASSSGHTVSLGYPMRGTPVLSTTAGYTVTTAGGGSVAATPAISSLNGDILYVTTSGASSLTAGDATLLQAPTAFLSSEL